MSSEWTLYDHEGRAVAYADDGVHIHFFDGRAVGYVKGAAIYAYGGAHLGWFLRGWIRDHHGDAVLFAEGTLGDGPVRPERWAKPMRGLKEERPPKGQAENRPGPPLTARSWSEVTPESFLNVPDVGADGDADEETEKSGGGSEPITE
jgi:hypothetical protein